MSTRFQMGLVLLAAFLLAGCVVVVRQPAADPFAMRVTKDGTEILLRHSYVKVKAGLEVVANGNSGRLSGVRIASPPRGPSVWAKGSVVEPVVGELALLSIDETPPTTMLYHTSVIEVRRVAEGLTQVQVKSGRWRPGFFSRSGTRTRDGEAEHGRLTELIQSTGW